MTSSAAVIRLSSEDLRARFDPDRRLDRFCELLRQENKRCNLVSRETMPEGYLSLAIESLVPLAFLADRSVKTYLDIGSGGGLPAIPLLLSGLTDGKDDTRVVLVERTRKKSAALRRIAIALGLTVDILPADIETARINESFDLITMRFVRLTRVILDKAVTLLSPGGVFAYYSQPDFAFDASLLTVRSITYHIGSQDHDRRMTFFSR